MNICCCHNKLRFEEQSRQFLKALDDFNKMSDDPNLNSFIYAGIDPDISGRTADICSSDADSVRIKAWRIAQFVKLTRYKRVFV